MTSVQLQDSKIALIQNDSVRKLTLVNLVFLPPSFIAAVFGMNTPQPTNKAVWYFVIFAMVLLMITMLFAVGRGRLIGKEGISQDIKGPNGSKGNLRVNTGFALKLLAHGAFGSVLNPRRKLYEAAW